MKIVICIFLLALSLFGQQPKPSAFQKLPFAPWQVMERSDWYMIPMGYGMFTDVQIAQTKTDFENVMDRQILEAKAIVSTDVGGNVRTAILVKTKRKGAE